MRIAPWLDGQHLNALGNQHGGFALHLGAVLQVFNGFNPLGQLDLDRRQRLLGQRRAGLGGITLPGQCIGQVQLANRQQRIGLVGPFRGNRFLPLAAFELIELFFQWFSRALVAVGQVFVDISHLLGAGLGGQPSAYARCAFARRGGRKSTARQAVQRMCV